MDSMNRRTFGGAVATLAATMVLGTRSEASQLVAPSGEDLSDPVVNKPGDALGINYEGTGGEFFLGLQDRDGDGEVRAYVCIYDGIVLTRSQLCAISERIDAMWSGWDMTRIPKIEPGLVEEMVVLSVPENWAMTIRWRRDGSMEAISYEYPYGQPIVGKLIRKRARDLFCKVEFG